MKWLLGAAFSLFIWMSCPALAGSRDAETAAPEIIHIDVLDGNKPIQMMGKRVQFRLHENLPSPMPCISAHCHEHEANLENSHTDQKPEPAEREAGE